jgi:hypothetical protein
MMAKLKKAAAVAVMVGGMVLSGGVAHGGDHIGNFCTVIGPDSGDDRGQDNPSDVIVDLGDRGALGAYGQGLPNSRPAGCDVPVWCQWGLAVPGRQSGVFVLVVRLGGMSVAELGV